MRSSTSTASCRERGGRWTIRRGFSARLRGRRIVLDEVHRLANPSELLKIAADHFPDVQILATGSSTLEATAKFRDTLTGRKETVWLTPMLLADIEEFGGSGLERRFLHGGLPPFYLADEPPARELQEWMDAYWAKDVQELPSGAPLLISALHRAALHSKRRYVRGHSFRRPVRGLASDDRQLPDGA